MFCKNCGTQMPDGLAFCPSCGQPTAAAPAAPAAPSYTQIVNNVPTLPEENRPLSPWAYWGLSLLYTIPVVGFVFLIVHSCSGANINRRNFARSHWCNLILFGIIFLFYLILGLAAGGAAYYYYF